MFRFIIALMFISFIIGCKTNQITSTQVETLVKSSQSWNGANLPNYPEGDPEITILKIVIPPQTKLPMHQHPEINAGVVLKGTLTVVSESNDTLILHAGDPIVELVDTWHYGENNGKENVEIIVFYAGVVGGPITVLKQDQVP